jgi:protein TonB
MVLCSSRYVSYLVVQGITPSGSLKEKYMFTRYASAVSSGTLMTFALLYVMQTLISLQPGAETDQRIRHPVIFTMAKIVDTPVQAEERIPPRDKLTKTEPTPPRLSNHDGLEPISIPRTGNPPPPVSEGLQFGEFSNDSLVNMIRVRPVYPARALSQGIEGYAIVEFDVGTDGLVMNAVVVESSHSVFDRESIKAALRFKFKPRVVDGVAVVSRGVQNLFTYNLDD